MKVYLVNIRKYAPIIKFFMDSSMESYHSLAFNFHTSSVEFSNKQYMGKIRFDYVLAEGESIPQKKLMDFDKVMSLARSFDALSLDQNYIFYDPLQEGDFMRIATEEDPNFVLETTRFENSDSWDKIEIDPAKSKIFKTSLKFIDPEGYNKTRYGVQLDQGHLVSTDGTILFESEFPIDTTTSISLPYQVVQVLGYALEKAVMYHKDGYARLDINDGDLQIFTSKINSIKLPNMRDENLIKRYNHESYIVFDRKEALGVMSFLKPFLEDLKKSKFVQWEVKEGKLIFNHSANLNVVSRSIDLEYYSPILEGYAVKMYSDALVNCLSFLESEKIKVQLKKKLPDEGIGINFSEFEVDNQSEAYYNKHFVMTRILE